ncbi:hypothetical protein C8Q79DRAFT_899889 [Trametes meyenii]|nr:hypothetical protein C8Q79DRAFT_899889 [Trametes meyenii]
MAFCDRCDRWFSSERALEQHEADSNMHHICYECRRDFTTALSLKQHYVQSPRHPYCQDCENLFDDLEELYDHYQEDHHYCDICNMIFSSEMGLHGHRRQTHSDRYCVMCKHMFKQPSNLWSHSRSSIHQGRNVHCPMRGCTKSFISNAALILHLESGSCVSRMDRDTIDRATRLVDRRGIITNPQRLIAGGSGGTTVTQTWATERAWNGSCYECYLCHRTYGTLTALNQHLQSPAHAEKAYRCPRMLHGCGEEFPTLSAFCQHVESEKCGVRRFRGELDRVLGGLSSRMKTLTMS